MKRVIAVAATAGLTLLGLTAGSAADAAPAAKAGVAWQKCPDKGETAGFAAAGVLCGSLSVPLDYAKPHGKHITLALSLFRHDPKVPYQGVMLTNPGGPGGSGLNLALYLPSAVPNNGGAGYDWIGFDPRGIGNSRPALVCNPNYFNSPRPDYVPSSKAILTKWLARSKSYATDCKANDKIGLLSHDKTTDSVADMESIRKATGQQQINYYGFSYGTYLGQVYASLHPDRVRRMVLDSNVDPRGVWYKANLDQDVAFDANINRWFAWIASYNSFFKLGTSEAAVRKVWYGELNALRKKPVSGVVLGTTHKVGIGPDEWTDIFTQAAYYRSTWLTTANNPLGLGNVFADFIHHVAGANNQLATLYSPNLGAGNDNLFAGYNAVQCTDVQWPTSWAKWQRDNSALYKTHPFLTWSNVWFNAPCLYWPAKAGVPTKVTGGKVPPILLIDETNDAATPYKGSVYVRSIFPNSRLLAEPGGGTHADSLFGDTCVDGAVSAYLASGALPARTGTAGYGADMICAPLSDPVPGAASARIQAPSLLGHVNALLPRR
ncbi:MAG TPA: alpha/beta hydrolase [Streptosporangiaceae bacterium]|nr:alpha/beta hydrolase [Streptosporangiaceae bacterium]